MKRLRTIPGTTSALILVQLAFGQSFTLRAQEANPTSGPAQANHGKPVGTSGGVPLYKIEVVARDLPAVNYKHRSDSTHVGFSGTALLPAAKGEAKVQSERGKMQINAKFSGLVPANTFGPEYLTYVLWAITPDGSPRNLAEILPDDKKNNIDVTTDLQTFGMIVTAEPYYAVTQPSDVVVMQNVILDKTQGVIEQVNAHYNLLPRGAYTQIAGPGAVLRPITRNEKSPLELYEAHNAVNLARLAGADKYSPEIMAQAMQDLTNADQIDQSHKGDKKQEISYAREAVERAEDARINSLRKQEELKQQENTQEKEAAQISAQQSQMQAQEAAMQKEKADVERARAEAAAAEAQAQAASAQQQAKQATDQTKEMREKLRNQLNAVLQTSETARGLIVNMSDVLFDTGKYTLKTDAREKLAKVSGILLAYPGLKLQVEGYTDTTGSEEFNQKLSEQRASGVRDYLVSQGVQMSNISATGFGEADPVADNATSAGRTQNRRVQLVVSGDAIGVSAKAPSIDTAPTTAPAPAPSMGIATPNQ